MLPGERTVNLPLLQLTKLGDLTRVKLVVSSLELKNIAFIVLLVLIGFLSFLQASGLWRVRPWKIWSVSSSQDQ